MNSNHGFGFNANDKNGSLKVKLANLEVSFESNLTQVGPDQRNNRGGGVPQERSADSASREGAT